MPAPAPAAPQVEGEFLGAPRLVAEGRCADVGAVAAGLRVRASEGVVLILAAEEEEGGGDVGCVVCEGVALEV